GNVYMLVGGGANITLQAGPDGVVMVDSGRAESSEAIRSVIQQLSDRQVHYIINTAFDADHTGGNAILSKTAKPIIGSTTGGAPMERGAAIIAEENVLNRMSSPSGQKASIPEAAWPTDTYFEGQKEVYFNGEAIQIMPAPKAHTDGDSIVYFRKSDVLSTGDIFLTTTYPVINLEAGGSINGVIDALNHVLDIAIPAHEQEGGTMIISGHGRLCDEHDVLEYRDMVTIIRDRVQMAIKKAM